MLAMKSFSPPGPGVWELDNSHFTKPMSLFSEEMFTNSLARGLKEGTARYGLALSHLSYRMVNGFFYKKAIIYGLSDDYFGQLPDNLFGQSEIISRLENGKKALESKLWREDLRRWDDVVKPDSINRNNKLQSINPKKLELDNLKQHLHDCRKNALEMMYRHHLFTIPAILPIGLYVNKVRQWTGLPSSDLLFLLKGSTPVSRGSADNELKILAKCLKDANLTEENFIGEPASRILEIMESQCGKSIKMALEKYLNVVSCRLVTGYDITDKCAYEMPEIILSNIWNFDFKAEDVKNDDVLEMTLNIRNKISEINKNEFDSLLAEARLVNRLRDERGIYNDVLATGLARRVILEVGNRLEANKKLSDRNLILHASHQEMIALLTDKNFFLDDTLRERSLWHSQKTVDDAPSILGGEKVLPKPPITIFPEIAREGMAALFTAIAEIYDSSTNKENKKELIFGTPVSAGIYEGTARIISNSNDFSRLRQGDVLIAKSTTASFNGVLSLLGAIVTDRGGQLSHAAIVSREYGIPAVVSTGNATQVIKDGAKVRVDGSNGIVEVLI